MLSSLWGLLCCPQTWLALLGLLVVHWLYSLWKLRNSPPGPIPLPIIGNAITFYTTPGELFQKCVTLGKTYGNIMSLHLGPRQVVFLNDIEAIREALLRLPTEFAGRPKSHSGECFTDGYKDIAFSDFGPVWQLQRKLAGTALREYLQGSAMETVVHNSVGTVCERLRSEKGPVDPKQYLYLILYNIIAGILYSKHYDLDDPEYKKCVQLNEEQFEFASGLWSDIFPFMWYLPLPENKKIKNFTNKLLGIFYGFCDEHRKSFDPDQIRDVMDYLLLEQQKLKEEDPELAAQITDKHIDQVAIDIFFAGTDTSALTLLWTVMYVAGHPEIQQRVHEEIDQVVGQGHPPTLADRKKLKFCEATVYESMRIRPIAPFAIPHNTMTDVKIGKYEIAKDTIVMPNIWAVHHDPKYWKNSELFDPDNFIEEKGGSSKPESFLPFSTGRRVCLGEAIAKPEIVLIFASLMQRFRLEFPEGESPNYAPDGGIQGVTPKPFKLKFIERE